MKRFLSIFLFALCLISTSHISVYANDNLFESVSDNTSDEFRELIIEKAIQVFPEYEDNILGNNLTANAFIQSYSLGKNEIVVDETRSISENESIHYTEYANGITLMSFMITPGKNIYYEGGRGYYMAHNLNAWITCGGSSDLLFISGVECRTSMNDVDSNILYNYGTIDNNLTSATSPLIGRTKKTGTSSDPAYVEYSASFTVEISTAGEPIIILQRGFLKINGDTSVEGYI